MSAPKLCPRLTLPNWHSLTPTLQTATRCQVQWSLPHCRDLSCLNPDASLPCHCQVEDGPRPRPNILKSRIHLAVDDLIHRTIPPLPILCPTTTLCHHVRLLPPRAESSPVPPLTSCPRQPLDPVSCHFLSIVKSASARLPVGFESATCC